MIVAVLQVAAFVIGCVVIANLLTLGLIGAYLKWRERHE